MRLEICFDYIYFHKKYIQIKTLINIKLKMACLNNFLLIK